MAKLNGQPNLQKVATKVIDTKAFNTVAVEIAKAKFLINRK